METKLNTETKKLPERAVYSDVVNAGLILPYKRKYTIRDFKKLVADGWDQLDARWIVLCSWGYYHDEKREAEVSDKILSSAFLTNCQLGLALM